MIRTAIEFAASVAAISFVPAIAQDTPNPNSRALQEYAKHFGVSLEEAGRRMERQREAGRLRATLAQQEETTFGGMYIEHTPEWRVVVRFTRDPAATLARYTRDPSFRAEQAEMSYDALVRSQERLRNQLRARGIDSGSQVLETTGEVEFFVVDPERVRGLAASGAVELPGHVRLRQVDRLDREGEAPIEGGRTLSANGLPRCTSGFTVYRTGLADNLTRYILTAGHCEDTLSYLGLSLSRVGERWAMLTQYDFQWNSVANFERPTNVIYDGLSTLLPIKSVYPYSWMVTGEWVCKFGHVTGYTCGRIFSLNYDQQGAGGFVRVHDDYNKNLSSGGDSGGPWYNDYYYEAWGIHSDDAFENANDAIFMPVDRITVAGIAILTSP